MNNNRNKVLPNKYAFYDFLTRIMYNLTVAKNSVTILIVFLIFNYTRQPRRVKF